MVGKGDGGDLFGHEAHRGAVVAFGQDEVELQDMGGEAQRIVEVAVVDRPDHVGDKNFILRGLSLLAGLEHTLDPVGEGFGHFRLLGVACLDRGGVRQRAQVVVQEHLERGIFGAGLGIGFGFGRRFACLARGGRAALERADHLLVTSERADHAGHSLKNWPLYPAAAGRRWSGCIPSTRLCAMALAGRPGCQVPPSTPLGYYRRSPKVMFSAMTAKSVSSKT